VFAEDEARLLVAAARTGAELDTMVRRRAAGQPLEHILGWAEFCGLRIAVEPGVFVPRRRTEFLVREAAAVARRSQARPIVVDLCCGAAAVGAALAAIAGPVELYAADLDPVAVRCARRNLAMAGGRVFAGDLYAPLPPSLRNDVDILVVNAPYVPTRAVDLMPPEARLHEPLVALDGGPDGLDIVRRVVDQAPAWLASGGALLVETSSAQAPSVAEMMRDTGLAPNVSSSDEMDATVVTGTRPR
jgi:release factor glutamine methyltransferase